MDGVHDRDSLAVGGGAAKDSRLGTVSVNDVRRQFPDRGGDRLVTFPVFPWPDGPTHLELIRDALTATGRLPCKRPRLGMPAHFTFENMENLHVARHGAGWVANIQFRKVPKGKPDCVGTPDAAPFKDQAP